MKTKILLLLLMIAMATHAEEWRHFTMDDGLAHNFCRCIAIDHDNNLWVGSGTGGSTPFGGISMWNGETWTTFTRESTDSIIPDDFIRDILVDRDNNIWFATGQAFWGGVCRYSEGEWEDYYTSDGICYNVIEDIEMDSLGNVWFTSYNGISNFDGTCFTNYFVRFDHWFEGIAIDQNGLKWTISNSDSIYVFDDILFRSYDLPIDFNCFDIEIDAQNRPWIGSWGYGIWIYDDSLYNNFSTTNGLSSNYINDLEFDEHERLWIATTTNMNIITLGEIDTVVLSSTYRGRNCRDIEIDEYNNAWIATFDGVWVYNEERIVWNVDEECYPAENNSAIQIEPNPFNKTCSFLLDHNDIIEIFDIKGNCIEILSGKEINWTPDESQNSGLYFVVCRSSNQVAKACYLK